MQGSPWDHWWMYRQLAASLKAVTEARDSELQAWLLHGGESM